MKFHKKGDVGVQFNWIYVLLAGGVILLFFGSLVIRQKASAETSIAADTLSHIDAIITGAKVTKDTVNVVNFGKNALAMDCNSYSIGNIKKNLQQNAIFGPSSVKGLNMLTWSIGWYLPYRLMNFLVVTSDDARYILVYNDDGASLMNTIDGLIPDKIKREKVRSVDIIQLTNKNNYKVRFILLGIEDFKGIEAIAAFSDADISGAALLADSDKDKGNLRFFNKNDGFAGADTAYVGTAAMLAGLFSENPEDYACGMEKALKRASFVHRINIDRLTAIRKDLPAESPCQDIIVDSLLQLKILSTSAEYDALDNAQSDLETKNNETIRASCPIIY